MNCIDNTEDPCYWRLPDHKCGRGPSDGGCVHIDRILKRKQEQEKNRQ